jgi:hypothetical protein
MPLQRWTGVIAAAGLSLAMIGSVAPAKAEEQNPAIDKRVERIVKAALQHIAASKGCTFEAEIVNEAPLDNGQRIQQIGTIRTYVRRPDRLASFYKGPDRTNTIYYDGKVFVLFNPLEQVYATWEAPASIDALFDTMKERIGFVPPLSALIRSDAGSGARQAEILTAVYVGRTPIRGVDCHHLAFTTKKVDFQMWIADGVPVVRRIVVTYKNLPGSPQYTATFTDWDFNAQLSDYLFTFDPPPDASRIEFKTVQKP